MSTMIKWAISILMLLASFSGCQPVASEKPEPISEEKETPVKDPLVMEFVVQPLELEISARDEFQVGLTVTNVGDEPIDPRLYDSSLSVNGRRSRAWDMAAQNRAFDPSKRLLPPTESVTWQWPLGEALFPQPGTYELVLEYRSSKARATVQVTPNATRGG